MADIKIGGKVQTIPVTIKYLGNKESPRKACSSWETLDGEINLSNIVHAE